MFNVSRGGAAVFAKRHFPVGRLVGMELLLPDGRTGTRKVALYGVVRRVTVNTDGNVLGIEFVAGAADHGWFARYLDRRVAGPKKAQRRGFTLTEACIALIIICVLVTMATPIYSRAMEQARVDRAAGNLRIIWSAQRIYWLEYRTFAPDLALLQGMDLVDRHVAESPSRPDAVFVYRIISAGDDSFTSTAVRNGSGIWVGQLVIDEAGDLTGAINGPAGVAITPPS
jgi:prepilin-type N-terminal cleavage/methylation domain-containing protein